MVERAVRAVCAGLLLLGAAARPAAGSEHALPGIGFPEAFVSSGAGVRFEGGGADGLRWVKATSDGSGRYVATRNAPLFEPVDLRGRFIKVRLRLDAPASLGGMEFAVGSGEGWDDYFSFTLPLFTDPLFNGLQPGEWAVLTFGFGAAREVGAPDRSAIRWISWGVRDDGTAPLSISWGGITTVDEPERGLLSITFDDGYAEHHDVAAPVMAKHGFAGTAYVMPDEIGDAGYMKLADLHALRDEYGWDVSAHHAVPFTDFEPERLERVVLGVERFLVEHGFDESARHLAYPLGKQHPQRVLPIVRHHYTTARLAGAGPETLPPGDRHRLRVVNVLDTTRPEEVAEAARRAIEHKHWLILMFHFLVEEPQRPTDYRIEDFARAMELIGETGIPVRTVTEVWNSLN